MAQRGMIMLALSDEVKSAVLADPEVAQGAQRGGIDLRVRLKLARGRPRMRFGQPGSDLLTNPRQQLQEAALKRRREELDPLEGRFSYRCGIFAGKHRV